MDNSSDKGNANMLVNIIKVTVESEHFSESTKKEVLQWISTANFNGSKCDGYYSRDNSFDRQWKTENTNIFIDIKSTVAKSRTLSDSTKKEVLEWFSTINSDGSECNNSSSKECVSTSNRKREIRSGDSSLEPNLETPTKRTKFAAPSAGKQLKYSKVLENQLRIDWCFPIIQKEQLRIGDDTVSSSESSPETPVKNTENMILPEKDFHNDKTPDRISTPVNSVPRQNAVLPKSKFVVKTPVDLTKLGKTIDKARKENDTNLGASKSHCSTALSENSRNIGVLDIISLISDEEDEIEILSSEDCRNSEINVSSKENVSISNFDLNNDLQNSDLNDASSKSADTMENLNGTTWKCKVSLPVGVTELRNQTGTVVEKLKIVKKCMNEKSIWKGSSDERLSDEESHHANDVRHIQTDKVSTSPRYNDELINNSKSEEENPDYAFHTALKKCVPLLENISKALSAVLNEEKSHQKRVQGRCGLKYDSDDSSSDDWKTNKVRSDLPYNSNEFDPEKIVSPVNTKVQMPVNSVLLEQSRSSHINMQPVRKSFLASLSNDVPLENADSEAVNYRVNYSSSKEELCKELYALYNEKVFDNKLPEDMSIEWSVRLQRTAGKYQCSKSLEEEPTSSKILLSTKILDSPNILRDVLIHEMCHAATRLLNNVHDGHGSIWNTWASKAVEVFPEVPSVNRCYSFETETKFTYRCTRCGHSFGRHRRSLNINTKTCGYCHGPFEILINT